MSPITKSVCAFLLLLSPAVVVSANENVVGRPADAVERAAADESLPRPNRELSDPSQLSPKIRSILGLSTSGIVSQAFGTEGHPFTTQRASSVDDIAPVDRAPWRATGQLHMVFAGMSYVCTASVIDDSILVTAAHCVHDFGLKDEGFADAVTFEPARHGNQRPFGVWTAKEWWIPKAYFDGTDVCDDASVCENDVAIIVLEKNDDQNIADVVGSYDIATDDSFGYVEFLGENVAQFTQLGYPTEGYDGDKMIRTDSLGYQDDPFNVIIGSNQTGGSSGGPWLQNFGSPTSFVGSIPSDSRINVVSAVTSWGYYATVSKKIQGASRFSRNTTYTEKSNIRSLLDDACASVPTACSSSGPN